MQIIRKMKMMYNACIEEDPTVDEKDKTILARIITDEYSNEILRSNITIEDAIKMVMN